MSLPPNVFWYNAAERHFWDILLGVHGRSDCVVARPAAGKRICSCQPLHYGHHGRTCDGTTRLPVFVTDGALSTR